MTSRWTRLLSWVAAGAAATLVAGCAAATPSVTTSPKGPPIDIGISLSLTGAFSADGQAFRRGYELWAQDVNTAGGLLGRPVHVIVLNDRSQPSVAQANYKKLITVDHVPLILGPFSSLITRPAAETASKYGYAMVEGAGGAPSVFAKPHLQNIFDVSYTVAAEMDPFVKWIEHLPPSKRPATAAYPMAAGPFTQPPVESAEQQLKKAGVRKVYMHATAADPYSTNDGKYYGKEARAVVKSGAQMVIIGSTDVGTVAEFMKVFESAHYNPKIIIAAAGPDQGQAFVNAVGEGNSNGIMVPNGWYGGVQNALSRLMVEDYIAKYGGTASAINADVAEAYSCGEILADAVRHTHSTDNAKIIAYLHSGVAFQAVLGPVQFNPEGQNDQATIYTFQWQNGRFEQVLPSSALGSIKPMYPKPVWAG